MSKEQFTQEYIAYILKDEAKGLQTLVPREGAGVWFMQRSRGVLSKRWGPWLKPDVLPSDEADYILGYEDYEDEEFMVLPTLFQLIAVIEGAGYVWERKVLSSTIGSETTPSGGLMLVPKRWGWCAFRIDEVRLPLRVEEEDGQTLLAAAQLAVRAVEEK